MILKDYQTKAVDQLTEKTLSLLHEPRTRQKLVFKAPTGAGKTVMMAAWLQRLAELLPSQLTLPTRRLAYLWIAPNALHEQSSLRLQSFFEEKRSLRCRHFDDLSEMRLDENDILFFNWQSISRDDALAIRDNENGRNLSNLLETTRASGVEIVAILDEAHLFASKGEKALALLADTIKARIEVDVSATPLFQSDDMVVVKRHEVVQAEMIKTQVELNPAVKDKGEGQALNQYLLSEAFRKREELQRRYEEAGSPVRPLLLIQLPSDTQSSSAEDKAVRELVEQWLKAVKTVTVDNGKLAVWLSGEKRNLEGIENFDSTVEVLLFKQAIALGWDCPRAAVLLIFREIKSETFTVQTVGRILRMPEHRHYRDPALNLGYVYTNLSNKHIVVAPDSLEYLVEQRAERIEAYRPLELESFHLNKRVVRNRLGSDFKRTLREVAIEEGWIPPEVEPLLFKQKNEAFLWNWKLFPGPFDLPIPKDVHFLGEAWEVVRGQQTRYVRTPKEIDTLLHRFCLEAVKNYAKVDSAPVLKMALLVLFEEFLERDEIEAGKIILVEKTRVQDLVDKTLERYALKKAEEAARIQKDPEAAPWDVPEIRLYAEDQYSRKPGEHHVLQAYFESQRASGPEQRFAAFLEENAPGLRWWYKNGDSGKEHFAVPYRDLQDEWSLFHVDFVLELADGTLAFFDTKTIGSDPNSARKHNALLEWMESNRARCPERGLVGGILIEDRNCWKFSKHRLDDHFTDLTGWHTFNPSDYARLA